MSTFDSTRRIDALSRDALLARGNLDAIEIEDALAGDDTQWEPVLQRRRNVVSYNETISRNVVASNFVICTYVDGSLSTAGVHTNIFVSGGEEYHTKVVPSVFSSHPSIAQKIVRDLGRLTNGWAGPESVAPSSNVLRDIQLVASSLPTFTRVPDAEVDPDDGSVVLRWLEEGASRSFSLTFVGQGSVTGFYSADDSSMPAWKLKASDSIRLAIKFNSDSVQALLNPTVTADGL